MALSDRFALQQQVLANFDYVDIVSGTGFETFFGFASKDSTGVEYHLTSSTPRSQVIEYSTTTFPDGINETKNYDLSPFRTPRTIRGDAVITFSTFLNIEHIDDTASITATIYHWDGTTATSIGTASTVTWTLDTEESQTFVIPLAQTHFKPGEILRLSMTRLLTTGGNAAGKILLYGIDPQNRDGTQLKPASEDVTTQLKMEIPFRIDL